MALTKLYFWRISLTSQIYAHTHTTVLFISLKCYGKRLKKWWNLRACKRQLCQKLQPVKVKTSGQFWLAVNIWPSDIVYTLLTVIIFLVSRPFHWNVTRRALLWKTMMFIYFFFFFQKWGEKFLSVIKIIANII